MNDKHLTREELLSVQFAMLQEIHNFCTKNNLTYYLAYGTLIGAVRHQGFIPWDDDVDIMMPVKDYEILRKRYHSDRYLIADCFNNRKHKCCFPRIYDNRTCRDGNDNTLGVYVDIYLIHGAPETQFERAQQAYKIIKVNKHKNFYAKWRGVFSRHLLPFLWNQTESHIITCYCKRMYSILSRNKYDKSDMVYAFGGDGLTEFFWKEYFETTVLLPFNGGYFCAPKNYHEVLSTTYGDYMKLPPEDKQHPYHGSEEYCWKSK